MGKEVLVRLEGPPLWTLEEARTVLRCDVKAVKRLIAAGKLRVHQRVRGARVLIPRVSLEQYINDHTV